MTLHLVAFHEGFLGGTRILTTFWTSHPRIIARSASCSATQGFKRLVCVCSMSVTDFSDFCGYSSHRGHPIFPLLSFQLGLSGIPENHEKLANHQGGIDTAGPRFGTSPFLSFFFLKKFRFSLEGLVRVEHLILACTRSDFGATLPGGSI